jgi:tRNA dimethylallyltransferase
MNQAHQDNHLFFIICGPTGSGKTDLSYSMAERFPFEIVNGDLGQCYKPLTIGTAKPAWEDYPVRHHLFDFIAEPRHMSVIEYRLRLREVMHEIWQRNKIPLVVGGSLFYIRSLFFPPIEQQFDSKKIPDLQKFSSEELWHMLFAIDPERTHSLEKNDRYRLVRALELWYATGILPSQQKPTYQSFGLFHLTFVTREREELYRRINLRVDQMMQQGWVAEVEGLSDAWKQFLLQKKIMGYDDILHCLSSNDVQTCAQDKKLMDIIAQKTRHYAKRQETFWRSFKSDLQEALYALYGQQADAYGTIEELNLTRASVNVYLDHIARLFNKKGIL